MYRQPISSERAQLNLNRLKNVGGISIGAGAVNLIEAQFHTLNLPASKGLGILALGFGISSLMMAEHIERVKELSSED